MIFISCNSSYSTKVYKTEDGSYVKIPDYKKVERDILFQLSAAKSHMTRKSPIIVEDVIDALKVKFWISLFNTEMAILYIYIYM